MRASINQAGEKRSAAVESLRALAALAVLEGHAFGGSHGYGGIVYASFLNRLLLGGGFAVYLFFALTGYLLYRPFLRRDFGGGREVQIGRYAANRVFRILPLYYVVLAVYVVVFDHGGTFTTWWRSALFLENFFPQTLNQVDGVMWSLVVEVQFYVLLPFLAYALAKAARKSAPVTAALLVGVGLLAETVRFATVTSAHPADIRWQYSLPSTFVFFVPGMLLALLESQWHKMPKPSSSLLLAPSAWFAASIPLWLVVMWRYNLDILIVPATFLMVGGIVLPLRRGGLHRVLELRPVAALGVASYSLYLWHFPILTRLLQSSWAPHSYVGLLLFGGALSIVTAAASYRLVEAPFLKLRRSWGPTSPAPTPESVAELGPA